MDKPGDNNNNKSGLHHPHDNLFKAAFYNKSVARDFLSNRLPADMKDRVDLKTLKLEHCSFVDEKLQGTHSDVVYSANIDGEQGYIYTLIEHQSTIDNRQALRFIKYDVQLLERHYEQQPGWKGKIPVVMNLLLYTGDKTYRGPQSIAEAFQDPDLFIKSLTTPFVIEVKEETAQQLLADKSAALVSILLKEGKLRDLCKLLDDSLVTGLIKESVYRVAAFFYIVMHDKHGPKHVLEKFPNLAAKEQEKIMGYFALKMKQTRAEGIAKGKAEGMARGKAKGFSEALKALVKKGLITSEKAKELLAEKKLGDDIQNYTHP